MNVPDVRDIAIIVLAAVSLVLTLILIITAALLWRLFSMIRREVQPIIKSVAETAATIKGFTAAAADSNSGSLLRSVAAARGTMRVGSFFRRSRK